MYKTIKLFHALNFLCSEKLQVSEKRFMVLKIFRSA